MKTILASKINCMQFMYLYIKTNIVFNIMFVFVCPNPIFSTVRMKKIAVGQPQRVPNLCEGSEQIN